MIGELPAYINEAGELDLGLVYQPTPKMLELHTSPAQYRAAIGGAGSGKSWFLLWESNFYCCQFPGCHTLLLRRDFKELDKGLIQDLQTSVPPELGKYNDSKHIFTWINGSKTFFGHCENLSIKDLNQYLSSGFSFIGIDEAGEFPFEIWDFLIQRNRNRVAGPRPTMGLATNPYGIGWGWIKKLFVEHKPVHQLEETGTYDPKDYFSNHSTILDNPFQMAKDPGYIDRLRKMSPDMQKVFLHGDVDAKSGQYFSNFSETRHVVKMADVPDRIKWEDWQRPWIGSDYGLGHFWPSYWMRLALVKKWNGEWKRCCVVYREHVDTNRSLADYARDLGRLNAKDDVQHIFYSPERFSRTDPQHTPADQFSNELRKYGLPRVARASNNRVAGATFLYSLLDADELVILECCPNLIHAIPTLVSDPDDVKDVLKPASASIEDDCYDAWRYGVVSMLAAKEKPEEVKVKEHAATIKDPIAKHFFMAKEQQRLEQNREAFKPVTVPTWQSRLQQ